jgi:hypothetical protein
MKQELDKALCEKYPLIFADRYGDPITTCMAWGFECDNGWYNLIDTLCLAIQYRIDSRNKDIARIKAKNDLLYEYAHGNHEPLLEYTRNDPRLLDFALKLGIVDVLPEIPQVVASQVKEKYGGLRFYYSGGDEVIDAYVHFAEMLSERTCEVCGAPGKSRDGGWIVTRCDEHAVSSE